MLISVEDKGEISSAYSLSVRFLTSKALLYRPSPGAAGQGSSDIPPEPNCLALIQIKPQPKPSGSPTKGHRLSITARVAVAAAG